jgi:hypothetical protein
LGQKQASKNSPVPGGLPAATETSGGQRRRERFLHRKRTRQQCDNNTRDFWRIQLEVWKYPWDKEFVKNSLELERIRSDRKSLTPCLQLQLTFVAAKVQTFLLLCAASEIQ